MDNQVFLDTITADNLVEIYHAALKKGDIKGVDAALTLLAVKDPHRAQHFLDVIELALEVADTNPTDNNSVIEVGLRDAETRGYRRAVERLRDDAADLAEDKVHDEVCLGSSWSPCTCHRSMWTAAADYLEAAEAS